MKWKETFQHLKVPSQIKPIFYQNVMEIGFYTLNILEKD